MFVGAQLAGAVIVASLLLVTIAETSDTNLGAHALRFDVSASMELIMGIVLTSTLILIIFATVVDPGGIAPLGPLAIGLTVSVDHLVTVPTSGESMNSVRSFGTA